MLHQKRFPNPSKNFSQREVVKNPRVQLRPHSRQVKPNFPYIWPFLYPSAAAPFPFFPLLGETQKGSGNDPGNQVDFAHICPIFLERGPDSKDGKQPESQKKTVDHTGWPRMAFLRKNLRSTTPL